MNNEQATLENQKTAAGTEKSIKIWSERTNKWRYVPKDPNYFKTKYHEYTRAKTCSICGSVINTQMHSHNRTQQCQLVRAGIANAVDYIEFAIAAVIQEAS
jgi:formamidopyrimidine-DNA glycosylase